MNVQKWFANACSLIIKPFLRKNYCTQQKGRAILLKWLKTGSRIDLMLANLCLHSKPISKVSNCMAVFSFPFLESSNSLLALEFISLLVTTQAVDEESKLVYIFNTVSNNHLFMN